MSAPAYAGFWRRAVACIIDSVLLLLFGCLISLALGPSLTEVEADIGGFVCGMLVNWLYFAGMESSRLQATWGKMIVGIAVTDLSGGRISFARATGRYFGKYLSGLIVGIGFFMVGFTEKKQALHDMMAGSLVVLTKERLALRNKPIIDRERGYFQTIVATEEGDVTIQTKAARTHTVVTPAKFSQLGRLGVRIDWTTSDLQALEQCHNGIIELVKENGLPFLRQWADAYRDLAARGLPVDDMGGVD
jgi:uncharacterized RDD family membrane protein YckC